MGWLPPGLFLFWQPGAQIFLKNVKYFQTNIFFNINEAKNIIIFLWAGYHLVYIYYWEPGPRAS